MLTNKKFVLFELGDRYLRMSVARASGVFGRGFLYIADKS